MATSAPHGAMGIPTETGVAIINKNMECAAVEGPRPVKAIKPAARTELEQWVLNDKFPEQTVTLGPAISESVRAHLKHLLRKNIDIFAWQYSDMTGVSRNLAEHRLNTYRSVASVAKKRRTMGAEKTKAMNEQVSELLKVASFGKLDTRHGSLIL